MIGDALCSTVTETGVPFSFGSSINLDISFMSSFLGEGGCGDSFRFAAAAAATWSCSLTGDGGLALSVLDDESTSAILEPIDDVV